VGAAAAEAEAEAKAKAEANEPPARNTRIGNTT
jgi:hypothetical protein